MSRHRSKNREDTWKDDELRNTLEEINRDLHKPSSSAARRSQHRSDRDRDRDRDAVERSTKRSEDPPESRHRSSKTSDPDRPHRSDKERTSDRDPERSRTNKSDRVRDKEKEKDRDRDKNRDRDSDRPRTHKRDKDKEEERGDRTRDKDKYRDSDRDKERDRERRREKERNELSKDQDRGERRHQRQEDESNKKSTKASSSRHGTENGRREHPSKHSSSSSKPPPAEESYKSTKSKKKIESSEEEDKDEYGEDNYAEDFEDYEDDFDEENEASNDVKRNGQEKTRQQTESSQSKNYRDDSFAKEEDEVSSDDGRRKRRGNERSNEPDVKTTIPKNYLSGPSGTSSSGIRFAPSAFSSPAARRQWQRAEDIRRLVDFDFVDFPLFEMPPVDEYSRYMSSFGQSGCSQVATQTQEDRLEREIQTEDVDMVQGVWTQHPAAGDVEAACGRDYTEVKREKSSSKKSSKKSAAKNASTSAGSATDFALFQRPVEGSHFGGSDPTSQRAAGQLPLTYCLTAILNLLEEEASPQFSLQNSNSKSSRSRRKRRGEAGDEDDYENEEGDSGTRAGFRGVTNLYFSSGYTELSLSNSHIHSVSLPCVDAVFAAGDSNYVLTVHDVSNSAQFQRHVKSLLLLWRVPSVTTGGPSAGPQECFYTAQPVTSTQLSPDPQVSHVLAGLQDGAVVLWSRNAAKSGLLLSSLNQTKSTNSLRSLLQPRLQKTTDAPPEDNSLWHVDSVRLHSSPSYNTAGLLALGRNEQPHLAPIVHMSVITLQSHGGSVKSSNAYQVASLDAQGTICLWMVSRLSDRVDMAGSEADPGLTAGSRWALTLLTELRLNVELPLEKKKEILGAGGDSRGSAPDGLPSSMLLSGLTECRTFTHKPGDTSRFFLGCLDGAILQQCRGKKQTVYPHEFSTAFGDVSPVTALSFYPFQEEVFLAGYESGSVCLYHSSCSEPVLQWSPEDPVAIRNVTWSQSRPSVFMALDAAGRLSTWDLLVDRFHPVKVEKVHLSSTAAEETSEERVVGFNLNGDFSSGTSGVKSVAAPQILLWSAHTVQVHHLAAKMNRAELDDTFKMAVIVNSLL